PGASVMEQSAEYASALAALVPAWTADADPPPLPCLLRVPAARGRNPDAHEEQCSGKRRGVLAAGPVPAARNPRRTISYRRSRDFRSDLDERPERPQRSKFALPSPNVARVSPGFSARAALNAFIAAFLRRIASA